MVTEEETQEIPYLPRWQSFPYGAKFVARSAATEILDQLSATHRPGGPGIQLPLVMGVPVWSSAPIDYTVSSSLCGGKTGAVAMGTIIGKGLEAVVESCDDSRKEINILRFGVQCGP